MSKEMSTGAARRLSVFTNAQGGFGDAATVVVDEGSGLPDAARRELARKLATGETAFINDTAAASISVVHPQGEIDFAGVAVLAAARALTTLQGHTPKVLRGRSGPIDTWSTGDLLWVRARLAWMPDWRLQEVAGAAEVERITPHQAARMSHTMVWAWSDKAAGLVRARTFAPDWDIAEAEGNGSGAMLLASLLGRRLEIRHGRGSIIFANPASGGEAELGGRVRETD